MDTLEMDTAITKEGNPLHSNPRAIRPQGGKGEGGRVGGSVMRGQQDTIQHVTLRQFYSITK